MDEKIREQEPALRDICTRFLERFSGYGKEKGFVFTLNQDLFVERWCASDKTLIKIPGIGAHPDWFTARFTYPLQSEHWMELPDATRLEKNKKHFYSENWGSLGYVKLHGLYGWHGKYAMIIGKTKTEQIKDEPVINWWAELFQQVLREAENLVVIGYSFRDEHINEWILERMQHGLRLHIINPKPMAEFRNSLVNLHGNDPIPQPLSSQMSEIWEKLGPYYPHSVPDFFVKNHTNLTPEGERFFDSLGL
ncbi:MAG: SIR2 family protein [Deltaproteobacteria bacterium]|nr:SIR2 family protein [Deltaproteobacteria bacterium]